MNNKKVRMVIEFELDEETINNNNVTGKEVLEAIQFHNHDTIDGFEIYPAMDGIDVCSEFFLANPKVVSKEIIDMSSDIENDAEEAMCAAQGSDKTSELEVHLNNLEHELAGAQAHDPAAVPMIEDAIDHAKKELRKAKTVAEIDDGVDAVFLPGKIHGCEDQLYIIYFNASANDEKGCFEIEVVDYERILKIYEEVGGDAEAFFDILPDWFHGEWLYCNSDDESFEGYVEDYFNADFICGRDGGTKEQLDFMVKWAREREKYNRASSLIEKIKMLKGELPSGINRDAEILKLWKASSDKAAIEEMFLSFADMKFDKFLQSCESKIEFHQACTKTTTIGGENA